MSITFEAPTIIGALCEREREIPRSSAAEGAADRIGKSKDIRR